MLPWVPPAGNPFPFLFSLLFLKQNQNPNDDEETRRKWRNEKELCPFLSPRSRHLKFDFLIFATDEVRDPMSNVNGTAEPRVSIIAGRR